MEKVENVLKRLSLVYIYFTIISFVSLSLYYGSFKIVFSDYIGISEVLLLSSNQYLGHLLIFCLILIIYIGIKDTTAFPLRLLFKEKEIPLWFDVIFGLLQLAAIGCAIYYLSNDIGLTFITVIVSIFLNFKTQTPVEDQEMKLYVKAIMFVLLTTYLVGYKPYTNYKNVKEKQKKYRFYFSDGKKITINKDTYVIGFTKEYLFLKEEKFNDVVIYSRSDIIKTEIMANR